MAPRPLQVRQRSPSSSTPCPAQVTQRKPPKPWHAAHSMRRRSPHIAQAGGTPAAGTRSVRGDGVRARVAAARSVLDARGEQLA